MKKALMFLMIASTSVFAEVEELDIGSTSVTFGTKCLGGYLFAFATHDAWNSGVSLVQILKDGRVESRPNSPIECDGN